MKTRHIEMKIILAAIQALQNKYDDNIAATVEELYYKQPDYVNRKAGIPMRWMIGDHKHEVKLAVTSPGGYGAKLNPRKNEYTTRACWHVYGDFLDALGILTQNNPDATIWIKKVGEWNSSEPIHPKDHGWRGFAPDGENNPLSKLCRCHEWQETSRPT